MILYIMCPCGGRCNWWLSRAGAGNYTSAYTIANVGFMTQNRVDYINEYVPLWRSLRLVAPMCSWW